MNKPRESGVTVARSVESAAFTSRAPSAVSPDRSTPDEPSSIPSSFANRLRATISLGDPTRLDVPTERQWRAAQTGARVGLDRPHESAHLHVAGNAPYVDDVPELVGTLHAALGLSPVAHARITALNLDAIRAMPGVVAVLTADDIPGTNDCGPVLHDDPILARGTVHHVGQPVFAVIATTRHAARHAAAHAKEAIATEALPALFTPLDAHRAGSYVLPPMHLERGHAKQAIAAAPHRFADTFFVGGQEQFYLEGQISYAMPREDGCMHVLCSTQHPSEMQHVVAQALGLASNQCQVECRRMGGGFGGKESQSALFACVAAVAAARLKRPVKLRVDRDDDFLVTGRRHCFHHDYEVGFDDEGRVLGAEITMVSRAGFSADLSGPVMTRAMCHFDNAYWLPDVAIHGYSGRTNTQSNTAFRGFGGPQGAIAMENILDTIARKLGKDALAVRRANFYAASDARTGNVTPYGQKVDDNIIHALVDALVDSSDYAARRADIDAFNAASPVLKRGLALTPVKFGISFNLVHLNQAGALVHVYRDGSVLVNHGGTEMGQGLHTKVAQVVAHELGIGFDDVRVTATDTHKVANTSATAASTGSDLNGKAAQDAARQIRARLAKVAASLHACDEGDVRFANGMVSVPLPSPLSQPSLANEGRRLSPSGGGRGGDPCTPVMSFRDLVDQAYLARVQLWSDGFYATPGLHWNRETMQGRPFYYFAYGAAVSEVIVDTLTGEWKCLRVDALHDAGRSLNPAVDLGQVEGAFIQGMGWLTTEELVWHPNDGSPKAGLLTTHAPSTYKIPTANDCPPHFSVRLYDVDNVADSIHRSKATGEPPLLLPFSVFFAIRDAVSAAGGHRVDPPLSAPATSEAILRAVMAVQGGAPLAKAAGA